MLHFLHPIWLFGISAILIPLIIHLWNVKPGRTLKIGSISLMGESSRQNSRSLKLMDLLLLLLRCLMIILLSILLAEPVWKKEHTAASQKSWVLAEQQHFTETYHNFKYTFDSLLAAGNELHLLEAGFPKADLQGLLKDTTNNDTAAKLPYWSLLRLLETQLPAGTRAFIFSNNRLNRFQGQRPLLPASITWKTYTPADSSAQWIDQAYLSANGTIRAVISESSPRSISRKTIDIDPAVGHPEIKTNVAAGKPILSFKGQSVAVDTAILVISIYNDSGPDAKYLEAALRAIQSYTHRKIRLQPYSTTTNQDLLFWLSSKAVPSQVLERMKAGGILFQYAGTKAISINSRINFLSGNTPLHQEPLALQKRNAYPENSQAYPLWEDGFGSPLLDLKKQGQLTIYSFYSRFNPQWSDLVWDPGFVEALLPLVLPEKNSEQTNNLDTRSSVFTAENASVSTGGVAAPQLELGHRYQKLDFLWFLLILIFFTERWYSFKTHSNS